MTKLQKILALLLLAAVLFSTTGCKAGCGCPKFELTEQGSF